MATIFKGLVNTFSRTEKAKLTVLYNWICKTKIGLCLSSGLQSADDVDEVIKLREDIKDLGVSVHCKI